MGGSDTEAHKKSASTKKLLSSQSRVWLYSILISICGALFGGDTGSIGSITLMPQFTAHFGHIDEMMRGLIVACILIPSAITGLLAGKLMDKISRKYTVAMGCFIWALGMGMAIASPNLSVLITARCVAGSGEGLFLSAATCYICETCPKHLRGRLVSAYAMFITGGIALGFFVCYGTIQIGSSLAWRLPMAISLLFSLICGVSCHFLPYSPRWLVSQGRREDAKLVLDLITEPEDEDERAELLAVVKTEPVGWSKIFEKGVRGRTFLGAFLNVFQQLSGIDFVLFYAPLLFQQAGLDLETSSIIASGVTGVVLFIMTGLGTIYIDKVGRRTLVLTGGVGISTVLLVLGGIYSTDAFKTTAGKWIAIIMIELFTALFAGTWAIVVRLYAAEIQPSQTRAAASSFGQGANQLVNTVVALTSPVFLEASSSGPYFLYGGFMIFGTFISWIFMPETRGQSLERIDATFENSAVAVTFPSIFKVAHSSSFSSNIRMGNMRRRSSAHTDEHGRPTFPARQGLERLGSSALIGSAIAEE